MKGRGGRLRFHPSLGIPLIITPNNHRANSNGPKFPSLFRDSSDHHLGLLCGLLAAAERFHPSLGIPLIITQEEHHGWVSGHGLVSIPL